jgi:hypothetical protein
MSMQRFDNPLNPRMPAARSRTPRGMFSHKKGVPLPRLGPISARARQHFTQIFWNFFPDFLDFPTSDFPYG